MLKFDWLDTQKYARVCVILSDCARNFFSMIISWDKIQPWNDIRAVTNPPKVQNPSEVSL